MRAAAGDPASTVPQITQKHEHTCVFCANPILPQQLACGSPQALLERVAASGLCCALHICCVLFRLLLRAVSLLRAVLVIVLLSILLIPIQLKVLVKRVTCAHHNDITTRLRCLMMLSLRDALAEMPDCQSISCVAAFAHNYLAWLLIKGHTQRK